ncbi:hypothetical protein HK105_207133 [Polyrhizophydium stewartii]|uniref:Uncharacterized protein n=1 Tax=Polyrhizophydium stewartii TaxID=2732419 RepID=A0ABR4N1I3_9FUNG
MSAPQTQDASMIVDESASLTSPIAQAATSQNPQLATNPAPSALNAAASGAPTTTLTNPTLPPLNTDGSAQSFLDSDSPPPSPEADGPDPDFAVQGDDVVYITSHIPADANLNDIYKALFKLLKASPRASPPIFRLIPRSVEIVFFNNPFLINSCTLIISRDNADRLPAKLHLPKNRFLTLHTRSDDELETCYVGTLSVDTPNRSMATPAALRAHLKVDSPEYRFSFCKSNPELILYHIVCPDINDIDAITAACKRLRRTNTTFRGNPTPHLHKLMVVSSRFTAPRFRPPFASHLMRLKIPITGPLDNILAALHAQPPQLVNP